MHILTISDNNGGLIDLHICTDPGLGATVGIWVTDINYVMLGSERWAEWNDIYGNTDKQKLFLSKVEKLSRTELPPLNLEKSH
ncbi:hypothetical protein [Xanthocytophaga flava]|uniref:hypothetical protein n=1 Tax=Xanthocytophaga flava TaxID=3048013 RepID=UPI0028D3A0BF|nr:hypothetical protein [Xanthocytophaga flavus]MDJ1468181.1 hypothetical protein [Xanthocytophaga flavus]